MPGLVQPCSVWQPLPDPDIPSHGKKDTNKLTSMQLEHGGVKSVNHNILKHSYLYSRESPCTIYTSSDCPLHAFSSLILRNSKTRFLLKLLRRVSEECYDVLRQSFQIIQQLCRWQTFSTMIATAEISCTVHGSCITHKLAGTSRYSKLQGCCTRTRHLQDVVDVD